MEYDRSRPRVGVTGLTHQSAAEAQASFWLAPLGIVPCDAPYPVTFTDAKGERFTARSDFLHERTGVRIEFKASRLNGKKNKAHAAVAEAKVLRDEALGFHTARSRHYRMLRVGWNHSLHKQAAVVAALTPAKVVLVLSDEPCPQEAQRLDKAGIFWRTRKTLPAYALFLRMASQGLDVGFRVPGHAFSVS